MPRFLLLIGFCLGAIFPAWAQVGLPLNGDGSVDYARCFEARKRAQIVFVLDVSGSMWKQNLPLTKARILRIFEAAQSRAGEGNIEWGVLAVYKPGRFAFFPPKPREDDQTLAPFATGRQALQNTLAQIDLFGVWGFELVEEFCDLAVQNYAWNPALARHIWIMGNGSFMGTNYAASAARALAQGFRVHTFYCSTVSPESLIGSPFVYQRQLMAAAGGGTFSCLTVQSGENGGLDAQILALSASWNQTLVPLGVPGLNAWRDLLKQEEEARKLGEVAFLGFLMRKITAPLPFDLVWASQNGQFSGDANLLPAGWVRLTPAERIAQIQNLARIRRTVGLQLRLLLLQRSQALQAAENAARERAAQMESDLRRARIEAAKNPGGFPGAFGPFLPTGTAPMAPISTRGQTPKSAIATFDISRLSDEFTDAQTQTRWRGNAQKWRIEAGNGVAILDNGAQISKTLAGDWIATARWENVTPQTAPLQFFARSENANLEFSFDPKTAKWRLQSGPTLREGEGKSFVSPGGVLAIRLEKRGDELTLSTQKGNGFERLSGTILESLAKDPAPVLGVGVGVGSVGERAHLDSILFARN